MTIDSNTNAPNLDAVAIDPNGQYAITTKRVVNVAGATLRPRHAYEIKGSVVVALQAVGDAISSLQKI